jgi:hypothetical protein
MLRLFNASFRFGMIDIPALVRRIMTEDFFELQFVIGVT